jgi:hypothetical protein
MISNAQKVDCPPLRVNSRPAVITIRVMELPLEIAERVIQPSEVRLIRPWVEHTRTLSAAGLVRPDVGELAELLVAVALNGKRAKRGQKGWDIRLADPDFYIQVKAVWHLPHRRRQNLGKIAEPFGGEIWIVEFAQDLSVETVRTLPGPPFAGSRLRVRDALSGRPAVGWEGPARRLGLSRAP